ncbi:hypothetical protein SDC9_147297 [bioreactor metagenome]|uniref:HTH arsR-type domain-containing protein n=1 Tax=bioreactor metagenome TaxID=1076179 RepID=A0A645EHN4_9ZZZZ
MQETQVIRALAALAQDARLRIFRALVVAGPDGMTPGVLATQLEIPANSLSFHLKELANAGLVSQERQGRNLVYRAEYAVMNDLLSYLTENCCGGSAAQCAPTSASCRC